MAMKNPPTPRASSSAEGEEDLSLLRAEIEAAAAGRSHPGDGALVDADTEARGDEGGEARAFFRARRWRDLLGPEAARGLEEHAPFLSAAGFAYFLPAILLHALDRDGVDGVLVARVRSFTAETAIVLRTAERRVTVAVLEHLAKAYDHPGLERNLARQTLNDLRAHLAGTEPGTVHDAP